MVHFFNRRYLTCKNKSLLKYYIKTKDSIKRYIPYNERYETVDCYPKETIVKPCLLIQSIRPNNIPFHERYETIDFIPKK